MDGAEGALVLFSGGQDSTTCLAWALERFGRVETLGFDYGQRHAVELECRPVLRDAMAAMRPASGRDWAARLGPDHTLRLDALAQIGGTALTEAAEIALRDDGLPNTFVPGRNVAFLVLAGALALRRGLRHVVGGMCETDYSGYPDCRDEAVRATGVAMNLGMAADLVLHTPLMRLDKAATWRLAEALGGAALVRLIVGETHTCYRGERGAAHPWGHGCGACPACDLRRRGWEAYAAGVGTPST